jgi:hypothetical protein
MAKSKVMDRPMFKGAMPEEPVMDVENVGIMQGFQDVLSDDDEDYDSEEYETGAMMGRTPDSPEILMNNLRGDMRSVDARREELADLVGTAAAMETPDSVLAMLQPVLAQQGIGGLPAPAGAMPPGPMPMPQGPMPEAGVMPAPGMMPAPGGISALMPPVAMAKGGIVQRFEEGSGEEGVTQANDESSSGFASFPKEVVETSREEIYNYLATRPAVIPDLKGLAEKRAKEYEAILGTDKKSAEAQMLLELAQRAFGYAANVDEQGRPLRGSQVQRFAGAVRTLPGALAKYEAETAKEGRAVKLAGIQAAEKEREAIRESNAKLIESKRKIYTDIVKKAGGADSLFGKGAWEWRVVNTPNLLARYAQNKTDEDETNLVESAMAKINQPRLETKIDPDSKLPYQVSVPPVVPDFITSAKKARAGASLAAPPAAAPVTPAAAPTAAPTAAAPTAAAPRADTEMIPTSGSAAPLGGGLTPPSMRGPKPTIEAPGTAGAAPGRTLWSMSKNITGPGAAGAAAISSIPLLGGSFPEVTQARNLAQQEIENLIEAFIKSKQANQTEQERLRRLYAIGPKTLDDPAAYRDRLIAIDEEILREINLAKKMAFDENLSSEDRQEARKRIPLFNKLRENLGVPIRIYTEEDFAKLPEGTPFLWKGKFHAIKETTPARKRKD